MKVSGPVKRLNQKIARSESASIEDRWRWGHTVLRDPHLMSESGKSLRHGAAERLITDAGETSAGKTLLSESEIQRRLRCARSYPYASQIRHAMTDFGTWFDLIKAGFPTYEPEPGEEPADPRTKEEIRRERERRYAVFLREQVGLFPMEDYIPERTALKELGEFVARSEEMSASFEKTARRRRAYYDELAAAVDGDLTVSWAQAHQLLDDPRHP
ncbi:hypothetical protein [Streptomyces sp. NPDC126514]|uniref:hypothetical protein n=1 Tax=Streptomyces sp. NPDC126514 TaxID=3155210 RepID=UPI00332FD2F6